MTPLAMEVVQVSSDVVETILRSLDEQKSSESDKLHPKVLKILAPFIAKPLAHLFNLFLAIGQIPNDWRTATVFPSFKKGRELPRKYRRLCNKKRKSKTSQIDYPKIKT